MSNILAQDTGTRANQSQWGTASDGINTWALVRGTINWNIVSNKLACNSSSGGLFSIFRLGSGTSGPQDLKVRVIPTDTADVGPVARYTSTTQYYYIVLTGGNSLIIGSAPSFATIGSASFSYSTGTAYWLRIRLVGTTLWGKAWADGSSEPSNWNINGVTNSLYSSGGFGLGCDSTSASNTQFDQFLATDASTILSLPVRSIVRTQVTKSLPVRVLVRTQQTKSLPIRAVIRTLKTISLPVRTLVRTQVTKSLPVRSVVRSLKTVSLQIRTVVRGAITKSLPVRTVVGTRVTESLPIRTVARTLHTLSLPVRSVVRTLTTKSLPVRTKVGTRRTLSFQVRCVVRGRTLSLPIRTVVASLPPATIYIVGYGRDGHAVGKGH